METNPQRNSQLETHPDDERGALTQSSASPSDGKISPCLRKLTFQVAAKRHQHCSVLSGFDVNSRSHSVWIGSPLRRPAAVRFVFAKLVLGAARFVTARRGIRRSRWPAIASTLLWPPYPVFPPANPATPARPQQRDQAAFSNVAPILLPGDASALLRRCAMLLPGSSQR